MSEYEKIKAACIAKNQLWEDPGFPAETSSAFYYQVPPMTFHWKRPKEIYPNATFMDSELFDVVPGRLGDRWLVSCFGVLFLSKGLFHRVVPIDQSMDNGYAGIFRFRIFWYGKWTEVLVDDRLPVVDGSLVFLRPTSTGQMWAALLEKAYAKLHGSYESLKYGNILDGLADLSGGVTESIIQDVSVAKLGELLQRNSIITAHYCRYIIDEEFKGTGIQLDMSYRIYRLERVLTHTGFMYVVLLKRPLIPGGRHVTTAIDNETWNSIIPQDRELLAADKRGIWISYDQFQLVFNPLEVVHLDPESSKLVNELSDTDTWHIKKTQSSWRRGVTAGGCRYNTCFFHINPQIQLILHKPGIVLVSLNQYSIMEPKVIGFSLFKMSTPLREKATQTFFDTNKGHSVSQYMNSRQVTHRYVLDAGPYLIVPTTYEPKREAIFSVRFFSSTNSFDIMLLDCEPQILKTALIKAPPGLQGTSFAQYETLFIQLADEHRTINAFDLQELLDFCLPNDYIKSCASYDTCKQIVLSLDQTGSCRINLSNFKDLMCSLKYWQMVFKNHALEKMGVLRAERLRDALAEVGFMVPEQVLTVLVLQVMRKDGLLRFGDFVSVVMHLHRAFSVFYAKGGANGGSINLGLTEWLRYAYMC